MHVRFLDGADAGLQEWVEPKQLLMPWAEVEAFLEDDRRLAATAEKSRLIRGSVDFEAAKFVFDGVRPKNRFRLRSTKADAGVVEIADLDAAASWLGIDAAELRAAPLAFEDRSSVYFAPWPVTLRIARRAAELLADDGLLPITWLMLSLLPGLLADVAAVTREGRSAD